MSSTSSCEHEDGKQSAQLMVLKRGTRWPGYKEHKKLLSILVDRIASLLLPNPIAVCFN